MRIHPTDPRANKAQSACPHGRRSFFSIAVSPEKAAELIAADDSMELCRHCERAVSA